LNRSTYQEGAHAAEVLRRAVGVVPQVERRITPRGSVAAFYWRTPRLTHYELEASDEVILALHTGGSRSVRTRTPRGWSDWTSAPGQLHIIPDRHAAAFKPDGRLEFVSLHFGADRLASLIGAGSKSSSSALPFRFAFDDPFARSCVRALCSELHDPKELGTLFTDSLTDTLCLHLLRSSAALLPAQAPMPSRIARARDRIQASVATGVSLQDLAMEAGMSRFHFAREFREITGEPPHRYLTRCRIEQAKRLLRSRDASVADIALQVGYSSQSHFTAAFRSHLGRTPLQYRAAPED
jgi:AraC family transcriptional regulator